MIWRPPSRCTLPLASNLALSRPCEIRQLWASSSTWSWIRPPTGKIRELEFDADIQRMCFSFGREQECLVGTVDLVYRNSWNEIRTLHFNGPDEAVVEALSTILGKMHQDAAGPGDGRCLLLQPATSDRSDPQSRFCRPWWQQCIDLRLARDKQQTGEDALAGP